MAVQPEALEVCDDRTMVAAFQAGDEDAFSQIVGVYYHSLVAEARRRLRSAGDAEDAVQETLLRAYQALDRFGGEYRLRAWLSRILANACHDATTRRAGELRLYNRLSSRRAEEPAADEEIGDAELRRKIKDAVESLPDSYRVAFILRDIEERSYAEVADEMDVTEPNARARVHRARSSLARALRNTGGALGGFVLPFRFVADHWLGRQDRTSGEVRPGIADTAAGAVRAGHCSLPLSATTGASASKPGLFSETSRQTFVDLSSLSQAAASPAAQAPLSPLSSISQVISQVAASPISQTLLAAAPEAAKASIPAAGTIATIAVAGAALISSGGGLAPPPASVADAPQAVAAAPAIPSASSSPVSEHAAGASSAIGVSSGSTQTASTSGTGSSVAALGTSQDWTWVNAASTATGNSSQAAPLPAAAVSSVTTLTSCGIAQWLGGATAPALPPPEPAGTQPTAYFSSDTLSLNGIDPAFVTAGGGTLSDSSGISDLHVYYGECSAGTTAPGLGVQLSNPAQTGLGVLQLTGAFVSSQTSGGQTSNLYRGTGSWIGGDPGRGPVAFAAQVEVDDPSALTSLRVAFFGDPGLAGPTTQAPAASSPAAPASGPAAAPQSAGAAAGDPTSSAASGSSSSGSSSSGSASSASSGSGAPAATAPAPTAPAAAAGSPGGSPSASSPGVGPDPGSSAASRHG